MSRAFFGIKKLWYTRCPVPTSRGIADQLEWIEAEFDGDRLWLPHLLNIHAWIGPRPLNHALVKTFHVAERRPGTWGAVAGLLHRKACEVRAVDGRARCR